MREGDIQQRLEDDIASVSTVLSISRFDAIILLRHYNWYLDSCFFIFLCFYGLLVYLDNDMQHCILEYVDYHMQLLVFLEDIMNELYDGSI